MASPPAHIPAVFFAGHSPPGRLGNAGTTAGRQCRGLAMSNSSSTAGHDLPRLGGPIGAGWNPGFDGETIPAIDRHDGPSQVRELFLDATEDDVASPRSRIASGGEWMLRGAVGLNVDCLRRHRPGPPVVERVDFEKT